MTRASLRLGSRLVSLAIALAALSLFLVRPPAAQGGAAPPEIIGPRAVAVAEGATAVARLAATDAETASDGLAWTLAGGPDARHFTLRAGGLLAFRAPKDFEAPDDAGGDRSYELTFRSVTACTRSAQPRRTTWSSPTRSGTTTTRRSSPSTRRRGRSGSRRTRIWSRGRPTGSRWWRRYRRAPRRSSPSSSRCRRRPTTPTTLTRTGPSASKRR